MPRQLRFRFLRVVFVLIACAYASNSDCDERSSRPLLVVDGESGSATLEELNPDWSIAVRSNGEQKEMVRSGYVLWGNYSDQNRVSQILLTDGSVLAGELVRIETDSVTIASRLWGEVQIARQLIRASLPLPAADPLERDRVWQSLQVAGATDRLLLLNGDSIAGSLDPTMERDGGGIFGLFSYRIELPISGVTTTVATEEIQAITFRASTQRAAQAECLLGFRDGSLVVASELTRAEPDITQISTAAGARLRLPDDRFADNISFIQPKNESVTYLSDLPAVGYKSLPLLKLEWPLGVAMNSLGGRLRCDGKVIFKGLGMHSTSRVAYNLDRQYRTFQAELALDDYAERRGSVVYRVLVERENESGERAWNLAFTSPIVRGGDMPLPMTLDVADATRLALVVEMADRADTRDYANWLNARLINK